MTTLTKTTFNLTLYIFFAYNLINSFFPLFLFFNELKMKTTERHEELYYMVSREEMKVLKENDFFFSKEK